MADLMRVLCQVDWGNYFSMDVHTAEEYTPKKFFQGSFCGAPLCYFDRILLTRQDFVVYCDLSDEQLFH